MGRYKNSGIGKGIETSPQTVLRNQEYENKVKDIKEEIETKKGNDRNITSKINNIELTDENNFLCKI